MRKSIKDRFARAVTEDMKEQVIQHPLTPVAIWATVTIIVALKVCRVKPAPVVVIHNHYGSNVR